MITTTCGNPGCMICYRASSFVRQVEAAMRVITDNLALLTAATAAATQAMVKFERADLAVLTPRPRKRAQWTAAHPNAGVCRVPTPWQPRWQPRWQFGRRLLRPP